MTEAISTSNSGPNLPHLFKWIKHRASKKENRYSKKTDAVDILKSSLHDKKPSKTLYKKSGFLSKSSDNINRIQTDLSFADHAKLVSSCAEFNSLQGARVLKSESMVMLTVDKPEVVSQQASDVICRHGAVQRTCRACMQLPALPPGHERVLRDLQRQEKKRIRESLAFKQQQQQQHQETQEVKQLSHHAPNLIQCAQPVITRVHTPRLNGSSPENIYEEIPSHFFKERLQQQHQQQTQSDTTTQQIPHPYNHKMDSQYNHKMDSTSKQQSVIQPQNQKDGDINGHQTNDHSGRPNSRQVSLGNLDFGMAKECHGFLVVPLRDKSRATSPDTQPSYWQESLGQHQTANNGADSSSRHNTSGPQTGFPVQTREEVGDHHVTSRTTTSRGNMSRGDMSRATTSRLPTSRHTSDSGYQDHNDNNITSRATNTRDDVTRGENNTTRDDKQENTQSYSHCKRCRRPHGLYHGVALCHSDVEDLRQELQYLDIAGFDKHKLRDPKPSQEPSASQLHDITQRRSAFSKYIPKHKHGAHNSSNHSLYNRVSFASGGGQNGGHTQTHAQTTSGSDAYKRQSMSTESDYFSSNYNTSQSDSMSRGSRDYHVTSRLNDLHKGQRSNYVSTSEKSNDTFGEYDLQDSHRNILEEADFNGDPDDMLNEADYTQYEYEYYLAKARHHNMLKNNVKRIIFSSESERSDVERGMSSDGALVQDDTISLTSVTSLNSELSNLPSEEAVMDKLSCRVHRTARLTHTRTSGKHATSKDVSVMDQTPSPVEGIKPQTRTRKPIRKKRKSNKTEYYKLPNFSSDIQMVKSIKEKSSDTASVSSQSSGKRDYTRFERDFPEEHILSSPSNESMFSNVSGEKLSCRVTDFKLSDIRGSKSADSRYTHHASGFCDVDQSRPSLYSNHGQINRNSNNRLLSDLMRMNHDRQLFSLL